MAPREEYDDRNNELDDHVGSEDEMDDDDAEVEEVDDEQNTSEEEVNEEDVDEASWNEGDAPEYEDEGKEGMAADDSEALTANEAHSSDNSLSSDEPIPTIENDEENYRPKKESPYLHGRNQLRSNVRLHSDNPQDDIEEGLDEDLEAELEAEMEDGCLIDEADLRDYLKHKRSSPGIHKWPSEACRLYKLLYLRGSYPILPWKWEWPFSRIHPVPAELFTPKDSQDKALIKAEKSDFHAEKALRRLFELYIRVSGYRQCGVQDKIAPLITKEIHNFVKWAEKDGDFFKKHDYVSPIFVIPYKDTQAASTGYTVVERCQSLVQRYRRKYARKGIEKYPRMIYIFVVIQHVVLVMAADTNEQEADAEPFPFAELDMSKKTHWLDSTLGIAIPVMLARESLFAHRWAFPEVEVVESDPDL